MEEEWHVSDSEEEDIQENTCVTSTKTSRSSRIPVSSTRSESESCSNHHIPRSLIALYERISNEGFITLHCQASRRSLERNEDKTQNVAVQNQTADNNVIKLCSNTSSSSRTESEDTNIAKNKRKPSANAFEYEEELFETAFVFPRKSNKSGINKSKKTKRIGSMENVINDLNRLKELNAQVMENQKQQ